MVDKVFKWNEDFNTGNKIVDSQHYELINIINDLLECRVENSVCLSDKLHNIGLRISKYVDKHFKTEEDLMEKFNLDHRHVEEHVSLHNEFKNEVTSFFSNLESNMKPKEFDEISEYLIRWLAYHILNTDKSMIRQIDYITYEALDPQKAYDVEESKNEVSTEPLLKALKVLYNLILKKNREIERKNKELERKVKERTLELENANKSLNDMLYQDTLTGLPNRRYVMEQVQKMIDNFERYGEIFSILFIDVDKFKQVNDTYGHENGDKVLKWIAMYIKENTRKTDIACRLGGDEFVVLCSHTVEKQAIIVGEKLNSAYKTNDDEIYSIWKPSLSVGISTISELTTVSALLNQADEAMYISKSKGGGITSVSK